MCAHIMPLLFISLFLVGAGQRLPIRRHHRDRYKRNPAAQAVWAKPGEHRGSVAFYQ